MNTRSDLILPVVSGIAAAALLYMSAIFTVNERTFAPDVPLLDSEGIEAVAADASVKNLAGSVNAFGTALFKSIDAPCGNIVVSPYSVFSALSILYAGTDGSSRREMMRVLQTSLDDTLFHRSGRAMRDYLESTGAEDSCILEIADALWLQSDFPFLRPYLSAMRKYYGVAIEHLDFTRKNGDAVSTINRWISEETHGLIPTLLKGLDSETRFVITDAVYFNSVWQAPFRSDRDEQFYITPSDSVIVKMMFRKADNLRYFENDHLQFVDIPYKSGRTAMTVILPKPSFGIDSLVKIFSPEEMSQRLSAALRYSVNLYLPRFTVASDISLKESLTRLGMPTLFTTGANLSRMTPARGLFVSKVIHNSFLKVNENGTEAAAATAVVGCNVSASQTKPKTFRADRPFLFVIRDTRLNCFLFMGKVTNPGAQ